MFHVKHRLHDAVIRNKVAILTKVRPLRGNKKIDREKKKSIIIIERRRYESRI